MKRTTSSLGLAALLALASAACDSVPDAGSTRVALLDSITGEVVGQKDLTTGVYSIEGFGEVDEDSVLAAQVSVEDLARESAELLLPAPPPRPTIVWRSSEEEKGGDDAFVCIGRCERDDGEVHCAEVCAVVPHGGR